MIYTAVIRQRGQLTIPDQVREMLVWLQAGSVVGIDVNDEEVRIRPKTAVKKQTDWDKIRRMINLTRSFKTKGKDIPASQFVIEDRQRH